MENLPLISVIVPVYKVEQYLDKCISSIINQTYTNLEIILVDDGSPDNCPAICDAWAKKDSRIIVIHKKNGGSAQARNAGLDSAHGAYIAFADSDDLMNRDMLLILYNAAVSHNADIVECDYSIDQEDALRHVLDPTSVEFYDARAAMLEHVNDRIFKQIVWNKLYKAETIAAIRFVEGKIIDDEFWTYRAIGNAERLLHVNAKLYFYRQQNGSIMHQSYSINRLVNIEAKIARLKFIQDKMPSLICAARLNLLGSCIYAGQMSLIHLPKEQLASARSVINEALFTYKPSFAECLSAKGSNKVWFPLARIFFWETCWLKNSLKRGL